MKSESDANNSRLLSVDCLRGIIMVIMALDHVREYWHDTPLSITDPAHTTFALFMTRWITGFCAPTFVFLAGVGAYLSVIRGKTKKQLFNYLLTRGFVLILLEVFYLSKILSIPAKINFQSMKIPLPSNMILLEVIWVLGCSMIILAALIWLPDFLIFIFSIVMILGHNALDGIKITSPVGAKYLWNFLHDPTLIPFSHSTVILIVYPLIPWIGVMALGYLFGKLFLREQTERSRLFIRIGAILTLLFIVLRAINIYGDPQPWAIQKGGIFTVLSFLNCQKYPPSLLYLLMTLGPIIIILGLLEKKIPRILTTTITFGRVPLFYFLVHLPYICLLLILSGLVRFGPASGNLFIIARVSHLYIIYGMAELKKKKLGHGLNIFNL